MFASPYSSSYYNTQHDPRYRRYLAQQQLAQQRALEQQRVAHEQRLCRAQYLPHEAFSDDDEEYTPWEQRAYAQRGMREASERKRLEAMRQEALRQETTRRELVRQQDEQRRRAYPSEHHPPVCFIFPSTGFRPPIQYRLSQSPPNAHPVPTTQAPAECRSASPTPPTVHPPQGPPRGPQRSRSPPINRNVSPSPPAPVEAHPTIPQPPPSPSPTPERRAEAATMIQTTYRIHRALRTIADIELQFDSLKHTFSLPDEIDYETADSVVTVTVSRDAASASPLPETPKLAFTPTNYKLHAYIEALNQLLIKLDGVESWGNPTVRKARRRVVALVEAEASRVEAYWKQVWAAHVQSVSHSVDGGKPQEEQMMQGDADGSPVRGHVSETEEDDVMGEAEEGSRDDVTIEEVGDASMVDEVQSMQEGGEGDASETWELFLSEDTAADTPSTTDRPPVISPKSPNLDLGEGDGFIIV